MTGPQEKPWFRAKRFGYGAGLPCAWQGWALLLAYVAALPGLVWLVSSGDFGRMLLGILLFAAATMVFVSLCRRHTEGGWRWRGGE